MTPSPSNSCNSGLADILCSLHNGALIHDRHPNAPQSKCLEPATHQTMHDYLQSTKLW